LVFLTGVTITIVIQPLWITTPPTQPRGIRRAFEVSPSYDELVNLVTDNVEEVDYKLSFNGALFERDQFLAPLPDESTVTMLPVYITRSFQIVGFSQNNTRSMVKNICKDNNITAEIHRISSTTVVVEMSSFHLQNIEDVTAAICTRVGEFNGYVDGILTGASQGSLPTSIIVHRGNYAREGPGNSDDMDDHESITTEFALTRGGNRVVHPEIFS
jgi:hypothetical protein